MSFKLRLNIASGELSIVQDHFDVKAAGCVSCSKAGLGGGWLSHCAIKECTRNDNYFIIGRCAISTRRNLTREARNTVINPLSLSDST